MVARDTRPRSEVAERIRAKRLSYCWSQQYLASKASLSLQTVSLAERGGPLTPRTARLLATMLGMTDAEVGL